MLMMYREHRLTVNILREIYIQTFAGRLNDIKAIVIWALAPTLHVLTFSKSSQRSLMILCFVAAERHSVGVANHHC
jgi:hypothetical protein